ncbi:DNA methyltransferase [Leptolyngbya sp. Heron Island J]|uniref:DNA methyltransferase n=1 Tax=Leptolyngbya sp. Heron Island J TaxID=1385935 RepID=UPI00040DF871|nr:DNA methyltransferase [Leptolyngbya sp. Heron Island J]
MLITNPKRSNESITTKPHWYDYYAGYSHVFTRRIIESSNLHSTSVILDPWNGSGTTTLMASIAGYSSIGIDLNPVMKIIAKAKQATPNDIEGLDIRDLFLSPRISVQDTISDPLGIWFSRTTINSIRRIETAILANTKKKSTNQAVNSLNTKKCLLYTALFKTLRYYLKPFIPSNPTWIKKPKTDSDKLEIRPKDIKETYLKILDEIYNGLKTKSKKWPYKPSQFIIGSSLDIPSKNSSIDFVLTSPPYCTRIDYGVATLPELALLSTGGISEIQLIRRSLMGTTTVPKKPQCITNAIGEKCLSFLHMVKAHPSKASKSYYYKNFTQYFISLDKSIQEINRVLKYMGKFVCVVQGSFYKDVYCDLPGIVIDMAEKNNLRLVTHSEFENKQNMANVNLKGKTYRKNTSVSEAVLCFRKGG